MLFNSQVLSSGNYPQPITQIESISHYKRMSQSTYSMAKLHKNLELQACREKKLVQLSQTHVYFQKIKSSLLSNQCVWNQRPNIIPYCRTTFFRPSNSVYSYRAIFKKSSELFLSSNSFRSTVSQSISSFSIFSTLLPSLSYMQ